MSDHDQSDPVPFDGAEFNPAERKALRRMLYQDARARWARRKVAALVVAVAAVGGWLGQLWSQFYPKK